MRFYLLLLLLVGSLLAVLGIIAPWLFSAKSTEAVLVGIALIVVALPCWAWMLKKLLKENKDAKK